LLIFSFGAFSKGLKREEYNGNQVIGTMRKYLDHPDKGRTIK